MIYLDSAALVKLVRPEHESEALRRWLRERSSVPLIASVLVEVEITRAVRRCAPRLLHRVGPVVGAIDQVEISVGVRRRAAAYPDRALRSLDALHLATAEEAVAIEGTPLTAFVTYDVRLLASAQSLGLTVSSPR